MLEELGEQPVLWVPGGEEEGLQGRRYPVELEEGQERGRRQEGGGQGGAAAGHEISQSEVVNQLFFQDPLQQVRDFPPLEHKFL